ncbi:MAG: signal peptide peptidase SppA [candidate division Zixibacteria bacterium]|nr:signal peptide peptidase SppA [candidate division Zixibacteria bacterium]MBU1469115.1 signal peptide peptidase SppA [candidate division Zixibacteria bacterium]MBU2624884.1 signal peptide peptidase SppA [candidate division Zixibacteria bacterium]
MARKRDIAIGVIIAVCFLFFVGIMLVSFMEMYGGDSDLFAFEDRIAIVDVVGAITSSDEVVRQIKKYGDDGSIAAILIHVDSPGGGVAVTQEIYDELMRVRIEKEKLIVVSMSSVGASGGYYLSCAADQIIANPGTLTGSIGVILDYMILEGLADKVGISHETIKSGDVKDVGSPWRQPTEKDRQMLQAAIDDTYEQFVEVVMEGRNLTREEVLEIADGSIFTGRQALDLGLVDRLGSYEEAIRITAELVGIEGEPSTIKERPRRRATLWDVLQGTVLGFVEERVLAPGPELKYLFR